MIAYLQAEAGADVMRAVLSDPANLIYAHAMNMVEVYYHVYRSTDEAGAEGAISSLIADGVTIRDDKDSDFWKEVGRLKGEHRRVSLADVCCLALARRLGAE